LPPLWAGQLAGAQGTVAAPESLLPAGKAGASSRTPKLAWGEQSGRTSTIFPPSAQAANLHPGAVSIRMNAPLY